MTDAGRERSTGLRYGWTTGACATAATTAAYTALLTGEFPDPVTIDLPKRQAPVLRAGDASGSTDGAATAGIVKDAGDDPDVTHGALVSRHRHATASRAAASPSAPARASAR